ncbi:MAG: cell wall-binding repeat-containing protein [Coriobacteriia bacterium]|nr:cell wall-binding repeat-containing protein [Coriobacteriia bacterium]MBN2840889.1 cell wall-binding repeat-containing protein [Coriobacteriia bacterium]
MTVAVLVAIVLLVSPAAAFAADDYPYPAADPGAVDPWGFYYRYCTSFVAWRMNRNAGMGSFYNFMDGGRWGNAGNWGANALVLGYPVNSTPAVGAIAWWAAGTVSALGHVAYVEAVNSDGTVVVEEYNYGLRLQYNRRMIPAAEPSGYIHFRDVLPDTTAPAITLSCVKDGGVYALGITPEFMAKDAALKSVTGMLDGTAFGSGGLVDAPGEHTLSVTATDMSGNSSTTTAVFTIDPEAIDPDVAFTTVAGPDRYETAIRMSQASFAKASCVVIATGENWPDALGGAALAGVRNAPILLTRGGSLPAAVLAEIERLGATSAVIIGGEGAVGPSVEACLRGVLGEDAVQRIGGSDRYETAESIARAVAAASGDAYDGTCFIATGTDFPDALAASPLCVAKRWPLLLTDPDELPESTALALGEIGATRVLVLGGASVVSDGVVAGLTVSLGEDAVTRLSGDDRYATAAVVAGYAADQGLHWDGVAIATGQDFPDALAGGALQGRLGSVMLLTRAAALAPAARGCLVANKAVVRSARFLGGGAAVCADVKSAVSLALE